MDNFTGPFDLLLSLITKHKLDITEVALGRVTDDFVAYIRTQEQAAQAARAAGVDHPGWDLGTASEFLVVAATLLDLKAARLLPSGSVDDEEDLALLEARDLLFVRLLQYRAYKEVSGVLAERLASQGRRFPRVVQLEPHLAAALPELVWTLGPDRLAALAAGALAPKPPPPGVDLAHLHAPAVSVREQAELVAGRVRRQGVATFRSLTADAGETVVVVARFLALLELFREGLVGFDQVSPLGELTVRWAGADETDDADLDHADPDDPEPDGARRGVPVLAAGVGGEFDEQDEAEEALA
ncbi:segregation/condensation protein A [Cellulosimicrobium marinum]|nr:segregation/condensation protein A [Cellulosimicrobium marinum]MCB7137416.1 segregation/condensation protein A [Cellulosimicrobium marinum]